MHIGATLGSCAQVEQEQYRRALVDEAPCKVEQQVERRCVRPLHIIEEEYQGTPRSPYLDEANRGFKEAIVSECLIRCRNGQIGIAVAKLG